MAGKLADVFIDDQLFFFVRSGAAMKKADVFELGIVITNFPVVVLRRDIVFYVLILGEGAQAKGDMDGNFHPRFFQFLF